MNIVFTVRFRHTMPDGYSLLHRCVDQDKFKYRFYKKAKPDELQKIDFSTLTYHGKNPMEYAYHKKNVDYINYLIEEYKYLKKNGFKNISMKNG